MYEQLPRKETNNRKSHKAAWQEWEHSRTSSPASLRWRVPPVPSPDAPTGMAWSDGQGVFPGYSTESRKWRGFGPTRASRIGAPHSIAQLPKKKFVTAAM